MAVIITFDAALSWVVIFTPWPL